MTLEAPFSNILSIENLKKECDALRAAGKKIVFTNGVFDLIHTGHLKNLREAKALGDVLIVAVNDDASTSRLKGENRPIIPVRERAKILAALEMVNFVVIFEEDTPLTVIKTVNPDVLAKGGDYRADQIVGADFVKQNGGEVIVLPLQEGNSSSNIVERIVRAHKN